MLFRDRTHAGEVLAVALSCSIAPGDVVVLALPRGGVPVAAVVAAALNAPLDVLVVRKVGVPGHPELAMGAVASGGLVVTNDDVVRRLKVPTHAVDLAVAKARAEVDERIARYRDLVQPVPLADRTVVLVDDGLATGATMRAGLAAVRVAGPARLAAAAPVGAPSAVAALAQHADEVVCPVVPAGFSSVGGSYRDFTQTTDEEVRALLAARPRMA